MRLIGLHGLRGSGKDTVCGIIRRLDSRAQRVAFADPLKLLAARTLGFEGTDDELVATMDALKNDSDLTLDDAQPLRTLEMREFLQNLGQGARAVFGETFWIDQALPYSAFYEPPFRVVTDVRLNDEAFRILQLNGEIWHIDRSIAETPHITEQKLREEYITAYIDNNGTMEELEAQVKALL